MLTQHEDFISFSCSAQELDHMCKNIPQEYKYYTRNGRFIRIYKDYKKARKYYGDTLEAAMNSPSYYSGMNMNTSHIRFYAEK